MRPLLQVADLGGGVAGGVGEQVLALEVVMAQVVLGPVMLEGKEHVLDQLQVEVPGLDIGVGVDLVPLPLGKFVKGGQGFS